MKTTNVIRACSLLCVLLAQPAAAADNGQWVATWGVSPFAFRAFAPAQAPTTFADQTLREKLRISVGGDQVRIRLSNELGSAPLKIGSASIALAGTGSAIDPATLHAVTFGGQAGIVIPPGAPALSDPIDFAIKDLTELSISIYLPEASQGATMHMGRTSYVGAAGDASKDAELPGAELTASHYFITGVYVKTSGKVPVVAAYGDSITDGAGSTPHAYHSWPDRLAERALGKKGRKMAIVNEGISGNQLLADGAGVSALARFDRDVLSLPGLTHIVLLEGINDIGIGGVSFPGSTAAPGPVRSPEDLIAGYRQLIARAHAKGVKILGATLTPFAGTPGGYWTPDKDKVRMALNDWIRRSGEFDGVIDFEAAVRDPQNPRIFRKEYNSGDNLHPGDAGYQKMADSIDMNAFK